MIRTASVVLIAITLSMPVAPAAQPALEYMDSGQWTFQKDCAVLGNLVGNSTAYGFQLWDATDVDAPAFLGDVHYPGQKGLSVDMEGDLAVGTDDQGGKLYLIDISTPTAPSLIQTLSGVGASPDVFLRRDGATRWCYTAGNSGNDFQVRDLTNPLAPVSRGVLSLPGNGNSVVAEGTLAVVGTHSGGLHTIDVSNPDSPQLLDSANPTGTYLNVTMSGTIAAIAARDNGFTLFDITDPANIVTHATVADPEAGLWGEGEYELEVREVILDGTTLYVICQVAGLLVYNVSDLDDPVLTAYDPRLDIEGEDPYFVFNNGVLSSGKLWIAHWSGLVPGVIVLDVSSPDVDYLGRMPGYDYVRDVDTESGFVYGCTGHMGIVAHEHQAAGELLLRGSLQVDATWGVDAVGPLAYIASADHGLVVGDFSDPDNPVRRGELDMGTGRQVVVVGDVAYVAAFTEGFHTVDVSNPDVLVGLDSETRPGIECINVSVVGGLAATSDREDGMNLWDVSNPEDILHIVNWPSTNMAVDIILDPTGDFAYLSEVGIGIHVIDISTPSVPALLNTFASGSTGTDLVEGYLHVTLAGGGVATYHQSVNPVSPILLASFNTQDNAMAPAAARHLGDHYVYVADYSGLAVFRLTPDTPTAVSLFDLAWNGEAVQVDLRLADASASEDLRLTVTRVGSGVEQELPLSPTDAEGLAWSAVHARPELANGGLWRYELRGREPGGDWMLLRSELLNIEATPGPALVLSAYPNPFNPSTLLSFDLPQAGRVHLAVYDLAGHRVARIHEGVLPAGPASFEWEGRDDADRPLASGVYFARIVHEGGSQKTKLVMIH